MCALHLRSHWLAPAFLWDAGEVKSPSVEGVTSRCVNLSGQPQWAISVGNLSGQPQWAISVGNLSGQSQSTLHTLTCSRALCATAGRGLDLGGQLPGVHAQGGGVPGSGGGARAELPPHLHQAQAAGAGALLPLSANAALWQHRAFCSRSMMRRQDHETTRSWKAASGLMSRGAAECQTRQRRNPGTKCHHNSPEQRSDRVRTPVQVETEVVAK